MKISWSFVLLATVMGAGFIARLIAAAYGYTYDLESYALVGDLVAKGKNVYAETTRYNYGPIWMFIVGGLQKASLALPHSFAVFRFGMAALLSFVDIGIFLVLARYWGLRSGLLYYLNPLTVILTGFNSHFDNMAILVGLLAIGQYSLGEKKENFQKKIISFALFGMTLIIKHILLLFPLWLAVREKRWKGRVLALLVPYGLFGMSFLPFIKGGVAGIFNNVFLYVSFKNAPLWNLFILNGFPRIFNEFTFFALAMAVGALVFRKKRPEELFLYYCIVLVIFAPAIADQYFTIVLPFISVFPNIFFGFFTVLQMIYLWVVMSGGEMYSRLLGRTLDRSAIGYNWQTLFLLGGFIYVIAKPYVRTWTGKHWIRFLLALNAAAIFFLYVPGFEADRKTAPIERAVAAGDYELANRLYGEIEKNGILAGSRIWNRLSRVRYYVTYYRRYRSVSDVFLEAQTKLDWERARSDLKGMPADFRFKDDVVEIISEADRHKE